ncbi:MAG TPA: hypothetical protein VN703_04835, partial [Candidatus Sulfopaludibacter sp.]|nr:hypothetical protein [Candidatus Sulfopaludibacter sp.]
MLLNNSRWIITLLIFLSCKFCVCGQQLNLPGTYCWSDSLKISSSEIILNEDSTFRYRFQFSDMYSIPSEGDWTVTKNGKQLILNSNIKSINELIKVEEIRNNQIQPHEKKITLFDKNNNPYFGYVVVNPSKHPTFKKTDYLYKTKYFKNIPIKEIALTYFDLGGVVLFYRIKDSLANDIRIHIQR